MSRKYRLIVDRLPTGITVTEGVALLGVSRSTFRGMVRDLREFLPITVQYAKREARYYLECKSISAVEKQT